MEEKEEKTSSKFKFFLFIGILGLGILILFKMDKEDKIVQSISSLSSKEKTLVLMESFPIEAILDINIYDDTLVKWKENKIEFSNINGEIIAEKDFEFIEGHVYFGTDTIYAMDKSTGQIYFLNKNGQIRDSLELDKEIFNLQVQNQNLIYQGRSESGEDLIIFDKNKVQVGHYSYEGENILTYATNKSAKKNALALIDLSLDSVKSRIDLYGENNEKLDEIDLFGEIVVYLQFLTGDQIVVLTDTSLHFIEDGKDIWKKDLNLIKDIYISKDRIHLLHSNYLDSLDFEGNVLGKIGFVQEYRKILAFKNDIILYGENHLSLVQGDEVLLEEEMQIIDLHTGKNKILIQGPEEFKIYEIISK